MQVTVENDTVIFRPKDQTESAVQEMQKEMRALGIADLFRVRHRFGKIQIGRPRNAKAWSNHWTLLGDEKKLSLYGRGKHVKLDQVKRSRGGK